MKRICAAGLLGFTLLISQRSFAQSSESTPTIIAPYGITIGYDKTTNLIFPYAIRSVDRGSSALIVQKAKGIENILQAKASKKNFDPTNLSIVTADGRFYSFVVNYEEQPTRLNFSYASDETAQISGHRTNAQQLEREANLVLGMLRFIGKRQTEQLLRLHINGIFHTENNLWLKLWLHNDAQADFQPAYVRFFLRDKKRSKRTALNETEIFPIYTPGSKLTKGNHSSMWAFGFKLFTIPKRQRLIIQIGDESGGRTLILRVKSRTLLKARKLPS